MPSDLYGIQQLRDLLTRADSYLSLLWHRCVPPERKDVDLTVNVEKVIGDLRRATKELRDAE